MSTHFPAAIDSAIALYKRTGERVRIMDVGDGVLDVPHTATAKRPAFAGLLVYIIQFFFPCCAFMRRS